MVHVNTSFVTLYIKALRAASDSISLTITKDCREERKTKNFSEAICNILNLCHCNKLDDSQNIKKQK
jgi:hypothetical protein